MHLTLDKVIHIINEEPELPGEPEFDLQELVSKYGLIICFRAVVAGTKSSLIKKFKNFRE